MIMAPGTRCNPHEHLGPLIDLERDDMPEDVL
jgi:hypothetical protein